MPEQISVAEFHARLKAQGVSDQNHVAFICPICGTVQSMASLCRAGATPERAERLVGFSCEGRLTDAGAGATPERAERLVGFSCEGRLTDAVRGCDWTLGGLFSLHELEVVTEDGEKHPRFVIASPAQARELEFAAVPEL